MASAVLSGQTILVVEAEPLIAFDLQTALEQAGARVVIARDITEASSHIRGTTFTAAVIDWPPNSDDHRRIARLLKREGVPFLFAATHPPEAVTTTRGAPVFIKPARPEDIVKALAALVKAPPSGGRKRADRRADD